MHTGTPDQSHPIRSRVVILIQGLLFILVLALRVCCWVPGVPPP